MGHLTQKKNITKEHLLEFLLFIYEDWKHNLIMLNLIWSLQQFSFIEIINKKETSHYYRGVAALLCWI